ncbi:MAG: S24/S26 family peptidase [Clostridia bacterium]|nr:S24/S26 family peptidase [Clostridia bacterium]
MNSRIVDNSVFLPILKGIIEEGNDVSLTVSGGSMVPFVVSGRDTVVLSPINGDLKKGDVAFFQRNNGQYVLHRIYKVKPDGFYFLGDSQTFVEGPIERNQIFALCTSVCRKGKWKKPGSFYWFFFKHIWIHTRPARRRILKLTAGLKHLFKKRGDNK